MKHKKIIGTTLAAFQLFFLVGTIAGYFYLKSENFRRFALRKIVEQADAATGGRTSIGGLDFDLSTLTAHLYDITVRGTEGPAQPPLLHADKLTVGGKIISALRHQVELRELLIEHPVVHFQVSRDGNNNLPSASPSQSTGGSTSLFDLAAGHVQLINGEIDYNDRKNSLDANLYDLGTDIRFNAISRRYEGSLAYKNGSVHYADYAPMNHSLALKFSASPEKFTVDSATLRVGSSEVVLTGQISGYANPVADSDYDLRIHPQDFAKLVPALAPVGDIALRGKIHYRQSGSRTLLQNISIDGQVASEVLSAVASGNRVELRKLQGTYRLADGNLQVSDLSAESLGGRVNANVQMAHLDSSPETKVQAAFRDISLPRIQQTLSSRRFQNVSLSGTVNGKADAAWTGSIDNIRAHSDLVIRAAAGSRGNSQTKDVPVDGTIHATYDNPRGILELRDTTLKIPSATLTASGEVSNRSALQVHVLASDLRQLTAIAYSFLPQQSVMPVVSGSATLDAVVRGSLQKPAITAQLKANNLQVEGSEWSSTKLDASADSSQLTVRDGSLVNTHGGRATFSASARLRNWSYNSSDPIKAQIDVQHMRLADLQRLAKRNYPVSGDLSASVSLQGSQLKPVGSGSATLAKAELYGEPIQSLNVTSHAADSSVTATLKVAAAAGAINADFTFNPQTKAYRVKMDAPSIMLQKLKALQAKNLAITGTVSASASGEGTLDDPQLNASIELPLLQVRQNSISASKAEVRIAQHYADFNLDSHISQADVHAHGRIALSGAYYTEAVIDTGTVPLEALMASYAPNAPAGFHGQTEFHATLKGPLKNTSQIEAHLSIPILNATYQALQISIKSPVHADYANSVVTLQPADIEGTDTSLRVEGKIPIAGAASATLSAQGSVNLKILKIFAPSLESSGTVTLDAHASGSADNPSVQGQVQLKNVAMIADSAPVGIEKLNGTLDFSNDHVQVSNMTGQVGGGQMTLGGSITYRPSVQFNLALQGKSIRLRYPEGLRSLLDANLAFSGTTDSSTLNGRVLIDSLAFTPDFDLSKFADQFSTGNDISQPGFADTVKLAIGVQSQENLAATSSQVSVEGQAALQVGGTAANPVITGRTTLTSGELFYRNVRYQLQNGVITFDNPVETHPVMNVSVTTTVEQYNLTLSFARAAG